jgi:hypothetical protein
MSEPERQRGSSSDTSLALGLEPGSRRPDESAMPRRRTHPVADLRQVALSQRVLIACLLGHLLLWLGFIGLFVIGRDATEDTSEWQIVVFFLSVVLGIVSGVFNCLVEVKLSGAVVGVFVAILSVVPCLGLFIILIVNTRATSALQSNGVRVGFLGAHASDLADLADSEDEDFEEDEDDDRPRGGRSRYDVNEREGW